MTAQTQHAGTPLPRYLCHKEVKALRIAKIEKDVHDRWWITPADGQGNYGAFQVSVEYLKKHMPQPGGFYVLYDDSYESFSPAAPFQAGYSLIPDSPAPAEPAPMPAQELPRTAAPAAPEQ